MGCANLTGFWELTEILNSATKTKRMPEIETELSISPTSTARSILADVCRQIGHDERVHNGKPRSDEGSRFP